jgi:hypothetical protein
MTMTKNDNEIVRGTKFRLLSRSELLPEIWREGIYRNSKVLRHFASVVKVIRSLSPLVSCKHSVPSGGPCFFPVRQTLYSCNFSSSSLLSHLSYKILTVDRNSILLSHSFLFYRFILPPLSYSIWNFAYSWEFLPDIHTIFLWFWFIRQTHSFWCFSSPNS